MRKVLKIGPSLTGEFWNEHLIEISKMLKSLTYWILNEQFPLQWNLELEIVFQKKRSFWMYSQVILLSGNHDPLHFSTLIKIGKQRGNQEQICHELSEGHNSRLVSLFPLSQRGFNSLSGLFPTVAVSCRQSLIMLQLSYLYFSQMSIFQMGTRRVFSRFSFHRRELDICSGIYCQM